MRWTVIRFVWFSFSVVLLATAMRVEARDYHPSISVRDVEDLDALRAAGAIDDETFEVLADLLVEGMSLNLASRDELYLLPGISLADAERIVNYRDATGSIDHPGELVLAGILTRAQVRGMRPFIVVEPSDSEPIRLHGSARLQTAWSPVDGAGPTNAFQVRLRASQRLRLGVAAVGTRRRLREVAWNARPWFVIDEFGRRGVLTAVAPAYHVQVPKYFAHVERGTWGAVVGTYAIGFAHGLTFDSTGRRSPGGFLGDDSVIGQMELTTSCRESGGELAYGLGPSPCVDAQRHARALTDFRWSERQRGLAFRIGPLRGEPADRGLRIYAWVSSQPRTVYQHDVYHTGMCPDPRDGDVNLCGPPLVYRAPIAAGATTTRFRQYQLPGLFAERLLGARAAYLAGRRVRIGVTGYAADLRVRISGANIDFRPSARYPAGGPFGAVGVDGAWGQKWLDLLVEGARTFTEAGGGAGVLAQTIARWRSGEVQWSQRYYARGYQNPYAGAPAAADEYEGLRARNELGTRLEYTGRAASRFATRALVDLWSLPSANRPKLFVSWRAEHQTTPAFRPGLRLEFSSDDLSGMTGAACADPTIGTETCRGEQVRVAPRLSVAPVPGIEAAIEYQHEWHDSDVAGPRWVSDRAIRIQTTADLVPALRMRARLQWSDEVLAERDRGSALIAASGELVAKLPTQTDLGVRYAVAQYVDTRPSTRVRSPNPEQWVRVDLVQRF